MKRIASSDLTRIVKRVVKESEEKSTMGLIESVINTLILPQYEHVICGFELKNVDNKSLRNIINYPKITITFIGGKGTKLYPQTPGVQKMYDDVLDDIWETVWDYTGISFELYSKYVKDCGKKNIYLKEQKEETYDMSSLEKSVADFVNMCLSEYELPETLYNVSVDVFNDKYGRQECAITSLFEKPFKLDESDKMRFIINEIKKEVNEYFGDIFSYITTGSSTVSNYNNTRDWYTKRKKK